MVSDGTIHHEHDHKHISLGLSHSHIHHHSSYNEPGHVPFDSAEHAGTRHAHSVDHGDVIRAKTPHANGIENDVIDAALYLGSVMEAHSRDMRALTAVLGPGMKGICPFCDVALASPREAVLHILTAHEQEVAS